MLSRHNGGQDYGHSSNVYNFVILSVQNCDQILIRLGNRACTQEKSTS